jgi:hypothetical protein
MGKIGGEDQPAVFDGDCRIENFKATFLRRPQLLDCALLNTLKISTAHL